MWAGQGRVGVVQSQDIYPLNEVHILEPREAIIFFISVSVCERERVRETVILIFSLV